MKLPEINTIKKPEWLKLLYPGIAQSRHGSEADHLSSDLTEDPHMREAEEMLLAELSPRGIYRILDLKEVPQEGFSIKKHLEGCTKAALLAVTTGAGIDGLLRQAQLRNMAMAVYLDTGASVLAEQLADAAERIIKQEVASTFPGLYTTSRFSPGYGDYPLHCQEKILHLVDAPRRIGLSLTSGDMLVPHKSVTALIGMADHPVTGRLASCGECVLRTECSFFRNGSHC